MKWLAIAIMTSCCTGHHDPVPASQQDLLARHADDLRADLEADVTAGRLYAEPRDCDYALWSGLAAAAGIAVDTDLVEYQPGEIHRRPPPECWPGDSDSTISNDQLTGYIAARWRAGDLEALQRLADYAGVHSYVMGQPLTAVGDVLMKEPLKVLLHAMIYNLSLGRDDRTYRRLPAVYEPVAADYARHVQTIQIVLHGEASGAITDQMMKRLVEMRDDSAMNLAALAVYTGDYAAAVDALLAADPQVPTYVRGERPLTYARIDQLFAADIILRHQ